MIEVHRVSKVYSVGPVKVPALREVSFRVSKGEFVVLSGASGAGKTTLLRLLYRDDRPSEGDIEVLGHDLVPMRRSQVATLRRSIGIVFQDAKLLPVRTVYENIAFVLRVLGAPRRELTARVFDALRVVGLSSRAQAYPAQLSQGEAQRAALARAIVRRPPLLLADEPTGNLDESMAAEILEALKDIGSGGTTIVLATPQARKAEALRGLKQVLGKDASVVDQLPANPLPASLEVTPAAAAATPEGARELVARLAALPEADEVAGSVDWVEQLSHWQRLLTTIGLGVGAVLGIAAILTVTTATTLVLHARRHETEIMRLVGASEVTIRLPLLLQGMMQGLVGAVLALGTLVLTYSLVAPRLEPLVNLTLGLSQLAFFTPVGVVALLAAGTLLGGLGGWLARAGRES